MLTESERAAIERLRNAGLQRSGTSCCMAGYTGDYWDLMTVAEIALRTDFDVADELREARRLLERAEERLTGSGTATLRVGADIKAFLARSSRHDQQEQTDE